MEQVARESESRRRELGRYVRARRQLGALSLRALAERSGVSNPYLSQIERGLRLPSPEILEQLAKALDVPADALYRRAGFIGTPSSRVDLVGFIEEDPTLSPEQKAALIRLYDSFRSGGWGARPEGAPVPAGREHDGGDAG